MPSEYDYILPLPEWAYQMTFHVPIGVQYARIGGVREMGERGPLFTLYWRENSPDGHVSPGVVLHRRALVTEDDTNAQEGGVEAVSHISISEDLASAITQSAYELLQEAVSGDTRQDLLALQKAGWLTLADADRLTKALGIERLASPGFRF